MDSMLGALRTQALRTALELGVAELLAERPRSAAQLADACGCDRTAMRRLLSVLSADGVLAESPEGPDGTYALTDVGRCLRPSAQGGLGEYAEFICSVAAPAAGHLTQAIREGRGGAAFESAAGRPFFEYLARNPAAAEQFDTAMHVSLSGLRDGVLSLDWRGVRTVADVGGGKGGLLAELLRARPELTGTLC